MRPTLEMFTLLAIVMLLAWKDTHPMCKSSCSLCDATLPCCFDVQRSFQEASVSRCSQAKMLTRGFVVRVKSKQTNYAAEDITTSHSNATQTQRASNKRAAVRNELSHG